MKKRITNVRKDKKIFSKTAARVNKKNLVAQRGGTRL